MWRKIDIANGWSYTDIIIYLKALHDNRAKVINYRVALFNYQS